MAFRSDQKTCRKLSIVPGCLGDAAVAQPRARTPDRKPPKPIRPLEEAYPKEVHARFFKAVDLVMKH